MSGKVSIELVKHRLEQAKEELNACELLYNEKFYEAANNRAYYSIFHSIRAILALEPIDFKRHKDVIGYFNKNYIHTEIFSKKLGHKITIASKTREDSDYDDDFIPNKNKTYEQIETAKELYNECIKYVQERIKALE